MALDDFGRSDETGGVDEVARDCSLAAMSGALEAVGFRTETGFDGLQAHGRLWGGKLGMVCSLLGTTHMPRITGANTVPLSCGRTSRKQRTGLRWCRPPL